MVVETSAKRALRSIFGGDQGKVKAESRQNWVPWLAVAISLVVWTLHSVFWWVHLEGDSPIYPLMSVRVLQGHHALMTIGQAHGGTLLVYLRALLFWLFGVSHFLGFFVNGLAIVAGVGLWTRFALKCAGPRAALYFGVLAAVATERFARAACTDYFAITMTTSGIMLNLALFFARKPRVDARDAAVAGLVTGFSWYLCRFSALYLVTSAAFFLGLIPARRREAIVPTARELWGDLASRVLASVALVLAFLTVIAFFTSDRFLGVNAEANLKVTVGTVAAIWLYHRHRLVARSVRELAAFVAGALVGLGPELMFKTVVQHRDRVTGLVRWSDIAAVGGEIPGWVGQNFSFYFPLPLGFSLALATLAMVVAGGFLARKTAKTRPELRRFYGLCAFQLGITVGAWFCIHTYMHLSPQYFFPIFFPAYLLIALGAAHSRWKKAIFIGGLALLSAGCLDLIQNARSRNEYLESGVLPALARWNRRWGTEVGFGHLNSNYNLMWAAKGELVLPFIPGIDERIPEYQQLALSRRRVFYVHKEGDRQAIWDHAGYRVLEEAKFPFGFTARVLERLDDRP